jgi:purine-nucleoside phosphorylase
MTFTRADNKTEPMTTLLEQAYGELFAAVRASVAATVEGIVVSGSGLNAALEAYAAEEILDLHTIPGFPTPTVHGHSSFLRIISIAGRKIAHFTGRCHLYEGFSLKDSLAQVALGRMLGAHFCVLTNSAGGMFPAFVAGDIMLIEDSLNLMFRSVRRFWADFLQKETPISGAALNDNSLRAQFSGVINNPPSGYGRLASGEHVFSVAWRREIALRLAAQKGVPFHQGTYIGLTGPTFETPAEARMYRKFGEAVGMSTVHEAEFARLCGMSVAGCSLITNLLPESAAINVSHDEVVAAGAVGAPKIAAFIETACQTAPTI